MNFAIALFAPLALLLPFSGFVEARGEADAAGAVQGGLPPAGRAPEYYIPPAASDSFSSWPAQSSRVLRMAGESFRPVPAEQVRIEQRMTIRITPRPSPIRPDMLPGMPDDTGRPRFIERKIGKCLPISSIAGVQTGGGNRLILFMRDRRIVSADLERSCRARDFYSGFYLASNSDGQLCVDRDTLLSRSGANCRLTRVRQLIEIDE